MYQSSPLAKTFRKSNTTVYNDNQEPENFRESFNWTPGSFLDPEGSFLSEDSVYEDRLGADLSASVNGRKSISNLGLRFSKKDEWKRNKECNVCERKFDKMKGVHPHHCRVCAFGVCGECSKRKINEARVCDVCFFKQGIETHEKRRDQTIVQKGEKANKAQDVLERTSKEFDEQRKKISQVQEQMDKDHENFQKSIGKLNGEKATTKETLLQKKETTEKIKENIAKGKEVVQEKESKLKDMKMKLNAMKLELSQKKAIYDDKKTLLKSLLATKEALDHRISGNKGSVAESDKVSFVNNSFVNNEKDGKYNISMQPVQI